MRKGVVMGLAVIALAAGATTARAAVPNPLESPWSVSEGCLRWNTTSSGESSSRTVDISLCGTRWVATGTAPFSLIEAERVTRDCTSGGSCVESRESYSGWGTDREFALQSDVGVFLINADLEGAGGSVCTVRGAGATPQTSPAPPSVETEGGTDWDRVTVEAGHKRLVVTAVTKPSYPYASANLSDDWSHRYWTGFGWGDACGWPEAQGIASASMSTSSQSSIPVSVVPPA